jgi:hypothetical protein
VSITVIAARDYEGVPQSRDVYADGARYRIDNSDLQVFSADRKVLALYPSGNWFSVYFDDNMTPLTGLPEGTSFFGTGDFLFFGSDEAAAATTRAPAAAVVEPAPLLPDNAIAAGDPADPDRELLVTDAAPSVSGAPARPVSNAPSGPATSARAAGPTTAPVPAPATAPTPATPRPSRWPGSTPELRNPRLRPVAFAPKTLRHTSDESATPGSRPTSSTPRMQRVTIRPKSLPTPNPDGPPKPESAKPRMMRVTVRPKIHRAAEADPEPGDVTPHSNG